MNGITHFMSAYLLARALKYKEHRFETLFIALAGILPDIDSLINRFVPFEHGVISHTYVGGMLFVLIFTAISYALAQPLLQKSGTGFGKLLFLGILGLSMHFLLDSFTFHPGPCSIWLHPDTMPADCVCPGPECFSPDDRHHLYFWPIWMFPPHINTIFPFPWVTYEVRVWVEVIFTIIISLVVLYLLVIKNQKLWLLFSPTAW